MKNRERIRETAVRLVILFAGLTVAHLGVTLFLLADLGPRGRRGISVSSPAGQHDQIKTPRGPRLFLP